MKCLGQHRVPDQRAGCGEYIMHRYNNNTIQMIRTKVYFLFMKVEEFSGTPEKSIDVMYAKSKYCPIFVVSL